MEDEKMEEGDMGDNPQVRKPEVGWIDAGSISPRMRRHLSDSIYLWACGEKTDDEDDDIKLSDRLIGWIILFMQGFAYVMLIELAGSAPYDDTGSSGDHSGKSGFLLPTVTGAMYLLISSTTHDLFAGFSLLVDGSSPGHRAFGVGLLLVHGVMVVAAMTVLVSTSDDSASVVLNAVTVLFIADLDEKALKIFLAVPQKWRLFWAIQSISISFALALIAILYVGGASPFLKQNHDVVDTFPTWFVWGINPAAVTLSSVLLSSIIGTACDSFTEMIKDVDEPTFGVIDTRLRQGLNASMKQATERIKDEPWFFFSFALWTAHGIASVFFFGDEHGFPVALTFSANVAGDDDYSLVITNNRLALAYVNAVLVTGLVMKVIGWFLPVNECVTGLPEPTYSSVGNGCGREVWRSCKGSRVPSLLIGWGIGYWLTSALYVIGCSWPGGGWDNAPTVLTIVGYIVSPSFWLVCVLMLADPKLLGTRFEAFAKPASDILRDRRRVEFWTMATVLCNILTFWIGFCTSFKWILNYYWM